MATRDLQRLIANDLRIEWRELTTQPGASATWLLGAGLVLLLLAISYWLLGNLRPLLQPEITPGAVLLAGVLLVALLPFGITMGINQSVKAIFERNDLDLLLTSPTPTRAVFASKLLSVAVYIFIALGLLLIPFGLVGLLLGIPRLLGVIPLLTVIALVTSALGMLLTLLLVRLFGARQARIISQILAAVSGVVLMLAIQIPLLTGGAETQIVQLNRIMGLFQPGELLGPDSAIWFPGRTIFLAPVPTIVTLAAALLLFAVTVTVLHRWFVLGASESLSVVARRRKDSQRGLEFARKAGLWRIMLAKDWRALIRDPYLISQTLLQLAYLLPLAVVMFLDGSLLDQFPVGAIAATALVVVAGTLASNIARICMSGEEAVDLLVAAPVPPVSLQIAKMLASLIPVWTLFLPLAVALVVVDATAAALAVTGVVIATASVAFCRLNNPLRARRQDLFNRKNQSDPWLILETVIALGWGPVIWWLLAGNQLAWFGLAVVLLLPVIPWWRARSLQSGYAQAVRG